ncbi:ABC transporter permease [Patescibacteria group bacterium]|nr:ABC transporter permease [Patescibacteria group bacterium]MDE1946857.1 ABC transporter permease [Patescibacteria group bacterium]MDE2010677.1 ABC transporter permease [Patescibacteria group bacterium]MDE2232717.1 ABC transporter permease [Patescibacteria group bacterium]
MTYKHIFNTAIRGLSTNRSRSFLTIFGIVIGITAIMLVVSLGAGAQDLILGQVQGLGTNTIAVIPGREPTGPSDVTALYSDSLKDKDITALTNKGNVPYLKSIMPVVFGAGASSYGSNTYQVTIFGGTDLVAEVFDLHPSEGQFFDASDVPSRSNVAVIGSDVVDHLFDGQDPVGQNIKVKSRNLRVVGVLPKSGGGTLFNFDSMVIMPYTTAQDYILGQKYFSRIIIQTETDAEVAVTAEDIKLTLRDSHGITDPTKDDFTVQTQQDLANRLGTITSALTWFLVAVASIALFVGGVGIMNIMLVAVTERTREIGLRKALGATDRDILSQFLLEAVLLTAIGGAIGIFLGTVLAFVISVGLSKGLGVNWQYVFPWGGALLGFGVSALVGLVFGGYPASQASKKSPIEALRYE